MELELSAPKGARDNQYLRDCEPSTEFTDTKAFCRKKIFKIDSTGEKRIIRSCGYIPETSIIAKENEGYCLQADNEGLDQKICSCYEDGCNSSPFLISPLNVGTLGLALAVSILVRRFL